MLLMIVILFAILWLPYRALLVYNSFAAKPWLNIWYLLFAKTAVFINSAINPIMYNAMSRKFRSAFVRKIFNYRSRTGKWVSGFDIRV
jgi:thyrotropin-releasing hormone receptor